MPTKTFFTTENTAYDEIKKEAGLYKNPNIKLADVRRYQKKSFAEVMTVVSGIYSVTGLTDVRLADSLALGILQDLEVLLGAAYLLNKNYGINALVNAVYDEAATKMMEGKATLKQISTGVMKLFDKDGVEFDRQSGEQSGGPIASKPYESYSTFSPDQRF